MNRNDIKALLKEVFGPNTLAEDHAGWVSIRCPMAQWRHEGGKDTKPSAGISVKDDDVSVFHCLACKAKGTVGWMLRQVDAHTGENHSRLIRELDNEMFLGGVPEWGERPHAERLGDPLDKGTYLGLYDTAAGHPYLVTRGITDETADALGLLFDPGDSQGDARILFPVYSLDGGLYGFSGRAVDNSVYPKVRDYHGLKKSLLLLGSHLITEDDPYVVLVEGLVDWAMTVQNGQPAVASMHANLTAQQAEVLRDLGKPVYVMYDRDAAGDEGRAKVKEMLEGYLPLFKVRYPDRWVFDEGSGDERLVGDPGELSADEVADMIDDARLL